ncbi:hypothetical protein TrRE_jg10808 [Triparma retinervis]|uniref:Methyltransferase domain-containing protein n=1 Tax=Triparma retinervis TaxID=2557542 RepID=A0A9W7FGZ9_9STRA|nr:hypothetical protein TrRE_jg10808 [Triparma retinervis]
MSKFGRSVIDFARANSPFFKSGTTQATPLSTPTYWNAIYNKLKGENFEWAVEPTSLVPTYQTVDGAMHASLTPGRWLVVGNGTSNLPQVMKEAGGKDVEVTACDFSDTVVRQMQSRQPGVEWVEMDCRSGIGEEEWDGVIDKGLIDGLYLAKDAEGVGKVSKSISRGLVAGGRWLTVSYTKKDYLSPLLGKGEWAKITSEELENVYLYNLLKRGEGDNGGRGGRGKGGGRRRRGRRRSR